MLSTKFNNNMNNYIKNISYYDFAPQNIYFYHKILNCFVLKVKTKTNK